MKQTYEIDESIDAPYENTLPVDVLRAELRRAWNQRHAFQDDIKSLPEVPRIETLAFLRSAGMGFRNPNTWEIGKTLQRELGLDAIPPKTEYECAAGLWKVIRDGILAAKEETEDA